MLPWSEPIAHFPPTEASKALETMLKVRLRRERLLLILARRNYSQNGLARSLGISSGYMSQLVRGDRRPSPRVRRMLLQTLQIEDFDELFEIEEVGVAAS